jgi:bifunctional non-homologous end joining protein LigD
LASGDFKFVLDGERLHGGWVLVRMKWDRKSGRHTNWLLIKHRDKFAQDGNGEVMLTEDRSIASGRSMATIAAGKGRSPKPFMLAAKNGPKPDAVWDSNKGLAADARRRAQPPSNSIKGAPKSPRRRSAPLPDFIAPQICQSVSRPPNGSGWLHEIKFDGYRIQLRIQDGKVNLKTRKGLDWTAKFRAIAEEAVSLPNAIIDGEIVALDAHGAPNFAALQGALSEQNTSDLIFYGFDLLFDGSGDLRALPLAERKRRLDTLLSARKASEDARVRFVEHFEAGGDAVLRSACELSLEGIVSKRADAGYSSGRSDNWRKVKCRAGHEVVIGGWSTWGVLFVRFWSGCIGVVILSISAGLAPAIASPRSGNCSRD